MVMDMENMLPVHLSESIHFSNDFVHGLKRMHAHDTYNHYATGLYNAGSRWYIGIDFDDQHPVIGELTNLEEYLHQKVRSDGLTYYGNGESARKVSGEHLHIQTHPHDIHDVVNKMDSAKTCSQKRMKTAPSWYKTQTRCARVPKTNLDWD